VGILAFPEAFVRFDVSCFQLFHVQTSKDSVS
jgi:hypothetical protein